MAKSAAALLDGTDIDSDGKIDLWEFLAYSLGRRKVAVDQTKKDNAFPVILAPQNLVSAIIL